MFTRVDQSILELPTFKALSALLDNYNHDVSQSEDRTEQEKQEEEAFLDAVLATKQMTLLYEFLRTKNVVADESGFRDRLREMWFDLYERSSSSKVAASW